MKIVIDTKEKEINIVDPDHIEYDDLLTIFSFLIEKLEDFSLLKDQELS